ncbi:MAG: CrcB family protein [Saprospiraceae bacterium]
MQQMLLFGLVFLGGGAGSVCRYGLALLAQPWQPRFPWATLAANGLACLTLGWLLGWHSGGLLSDQRRLLLATGFCGGFSTFSTFTAESWQLFQEGQTAAALTNVGLSLVLTFGCLFLGLKLST